VRLSSRSTDDADVIRARLRTVLEQARRPSGWVPEVDPLSDPAEPFDDGQLDEEQLGDDEGPESRDTAPEGLGRHRAPATTVRLTPGRHGVWALAAAGLNHPFTNALKAAVTIS